MLSPWFQVLVEIPSTPISWLMGVGTGDTWQKVHSTSSVVTPVVDTCPLTPTHHWANPAHVTLKTTSVLSKMAWSLIKGSLNVGVKTKYTKFTKFHDRFMKDILKSKTISYWPSCAAAPAISTAKMKTALILIYTWNMDKMDKHGCRFRENELCIGL